MIFAKGYLFPPSFLDLLETFTRPVERDALNMAIHRYMYRGDIPNFSNMNLKRTWIGIFPYLKKSRNAALAKESEESRDELGTISRESQEKVETNSEQSQDIKDKGIRNKEIPPKSPQGGHEVAFNLFWEQYPRKVGKIAARKAFDRAIKLATIEDMLMAIDRQRVSDQWKKDNGAFIPHPATWLNQGRWEDEQTVVETERPRKEITDIKQCPKCGSFDIRRSLDYGICDYCGCGFQWNYKAEKWESEE